jgi:hypothetical protein
MKTPWRKFWERFWGVNGYFNWWSLRSVGNLVVLKVSYPVLALTPFISEYKAISQFLHIYNNAITLAAFFASLFLAAANLIYDAFCPEIVKKFDSPNVLYREMLDIKLRSIIGQPDDKFDASLEHCKGSYNTSAESRRAIGTACALSYLLSMALFGYIFVNRVFVVVYGMFSG